MNKSLFFSTAPFLVLFQGAPTPTTCMHTHRDYLPGLCQVLGLRSSEQLAPASNSSRLFWEAFCLPVTSIN